MKKKLKNGSYLFFRRWNKNILWLYRKRKLEISTFEGSALDRSLNIYIREKDINRCDINEVCYNYDPVNTKKSAKQLGIPEGAVLTIKLKSDFNK